MPFGRKSAKPRPMLNEPGLFEYAVKALGRSMRTESELRRLMKQRVEPGPAGEAAMTTVVARLKDYGYLDDQAFAETYARLRQENEKFGARRVRQALGQKGVSQAIVGEVMDARYGNTDEEALARAHVERKRIHKPTNQKETARVMRRLVSAGFSMGAIARVLRQWDVPEETLSQLESIDLDSHE